jgi:hypothetical protein
MLRAMPINPHKVNRSLLIVIFSIARIAAGIFMIYGQFAFAEHGTFYGFFWPHNVHDVLANFRTISLFVSAAWLIQSGIWGNKPASHTEDKPSDNKES